jgi:phenylpropionate dioxygenase-like ring-hydroxylating dioxygenase large terminal subunit
MSDVVTTEALLDALAARSTADDDWTTLPPQAYRSQEIFDLEVERVFRRGWMNVGHISQLPDPGDFRTIDMFGELLVVTRGHDDEINVLSRVCTHRWMDVCAGRRTGTVPSLQCPYHRWTFSHDGELRAAPEMAETPGFDKADHGLHRFRHEIWEGFIYVNLDGQASPTTELWGAMSDQLREYGLVDWEVVDSTPWGESAWDWKVFIDNGECYHHIGIHHDTLEPFMPARKAVDLPDNGEYTLLYAMMDESILVPSSDGGLDGAADDPPAPGLTERQRTGLGLAYPFPNYVIAVMPQSAIWFEVHPLGPGRIDLTTHLMLPPHLADAPGAAERIAGHNETVTAIHEQDMIVCEGVQRGLEAASARPGMLCHLEQHNRSFARWYARQISTP